MLRGEATFESELAPEQVWTVLSDVQKIGRCVPGVEAIQVRDERTAVWTVAIKVGPLTQRLAVETQIVEQVRPSRIAFSGRGPNLEISGTVRLEPTPAGTRVDYQVALNPQGALARILENFLKSKVDAQTQQFIENVKSMLRTAFPCGDPLSPTTPAASPDTGSP